MTEESQTRPANPPSGVDADETDHPILVGIGASAGGIEALNSFLDSFDGDDHFSFGVVIHLSPDVESNLAEILDRHSHMNVVEADDGDPIRPDHVYVIPSNASLEVDGEDFRVTTYEDSTRHLRPIDRFFESIAETYPGDAVGVILSGAGSDGTIGMKALKQKGFLTLAQSPDQASYPSMPQSALSAGVVDETVEIDALYDRLAAYYRVLNHLTDAGDQSKSPARTTTEALDEICQNLRDETGHDFSRYKRSTMTRRIGRRMLAVGVETIDEYADHLNDHPDEADRLHAELLITVTAFFRDADAFDRLEELVDELVSDPDRDQLRIWSVGCSTGQEAYSLAILVAEALDRHDRDLPVNIFATDIDEPSLTTARLAVYPSTIRDEVSEERLARFFTQTDNGYQVTSRLRAMCVFSVHDVTSDPPFSRIDLLSCRNVLIYMQPDLQSKVIPLLHYAVRPDGYLFLGPADTVGKRDDLFDVLDVRQRLFRAREGPPTFTPTFPVHGDLRQTRPVDAIDSKPAIPDRELGTGFQRRLMDRFGPPAALVDDDDQILYMSGRLGDFLEHSTGPLKDNIVDLARGDIRVHLRSTLKKARELDQEVTVQNLNLNLQDRLETFDLIVSPMRAAQLDRKLWMVVFRVSPGSQRTDIEETDDEITRDEVVQQLEAELQQTREHLESTITQLEGANEEMKAYNEELLSMNEELQSSNEELQTSQEEVQSVNTELERVNEDLQQKVQQLDRANADMKNLLESTQIPTVFLDKELRIQQFTPSARDVFRLIDSDRGRKLADITLRVEGVDLPGAIRRVLDTLAPEEVRVRRLPDEDDDEDDEKVYLLRIHPYRTLDDVIDGVVLTFVDVTELEQTTRRLEEREQQQSTAAQLGIEALSNPDYDGFADIALERASQILGADAATFYTLDEEHQQLGLHSSVGLDEQTLQTVDLTTNESPLINFTLRREEPVVVGDIQTEQRFGGDPLAEALEMRSSLSCVVPNDEEAHGILTLHARQPDTFSQEDGDFLLVLAHILQSAHARQERFDYLKEQEARLRQITDAAPALMWMAGPDGDFSWFNRRWVDFTGQPAEGRPEGSWEGVIHPEDRPRVEELHREAMKERDEFSVEFRLQRADGDYRWMSEHARPWYGEEGEFMGFLGACFDITDRKEYEEANQMKDEFLAMLGHELRNPLAAITTTVGVLEQSHDIGEEESEMFAILDRQTDQMARLLDGVLDVSRIQRGKVTLDRRTLDLTEVVSDVATDWTGRIDGENLDFRVDTPDDEPIWVSLDLTRFGQVVGNLLSNAIRFTEPPGEIGLTLRRQEESAVIEVRDTGSGLDEEDIAQIFKPFQQINRPSDGEHAGLGMGLSLARGLAKLHGGDLSVVSPGRGEGSTFQITLPLTSPPEESDSDLASVDGASKSLRVLLIEDNEDIGRLFGADLEQHGHRVRLASNGEDGVEQAREFHPDVVICDIGLPGAWDGNEVARRLRSDEAFAETYLVALTGYGQESAQETARQAGFDEFFVKPITTEDLTDCLNSLGPLNGHDS